jgi:N-acetylneuraminate synthase/N,N'-diacetyllegionaminate synthase
MIKKLELSDEDFTRLFDYAKQRDIIFLSSPFDEESVDLLDSLGVPAFKVASGEITNFRLLRHVARKSKPIILSTGMSAIDEIADALNVIKKEGNKEIILLHCVTSYPARMEDANLKVIETLRNRFNLPIGFSDHTLGIAAPIAATTLGAVLIEKHFTLDKHLPGPDHKASLDPDELKNMIRTIRDVEKSLGDGTKKLTEDEDKIKQIARRSIVARVEIPKGSLITEDMLDFKRPGIGIAPKYVEKMLGKEAKHRIKKDELIDWDALK